MSLVINFKISDFNISGNSIPQDVADKILKYHIQPMQPIRRKMGIPIWPSEKSGYRSSVWEKKKKRSGKSEHTFKGKGAVDWTCETFETNKDSFLQHIIDMTEYTRVAVYNSFIHCDYKPTNSGKREIYESDSKSNWTLVKEI